MRPTWAVQQVVGCLGYSGRDADVVVTPALDPERTLQAADHCIAKGSIALDVAALLIGDHDLGLPDCGRVRALPDATRMGKPSQIARCTLHCLDRAVFATSAVG